MALDSASAQQIAVGQLIRDEFDRRLRESLQKVADEVLNEVIHGLRDDVLLQARFEKIFSENADRLIIEVLDGRSKKP